MKSKHVLFAILGLTICFSYSNVDPPQAEISNGIINVRILLPDAASGYYRGTRFDWSGVVQDLEYEGHHYFGQWFEEYSPTMHDAIMGPVEEFAPLGYDDAGQRGSFVKIGVGVLQKPLNDSIYNRFNYYPIEDNGKWQIQRSIDEITFIQELHHPDYSYAYTKTIRLVPGQPQMEIIHTLKNIGKKTIETSVYDHNFFVIDSQLTGSGFTVTFPFVVLADTGKIGDIEEINGNRINFKRDLVQGETIRLGTITGFSHDARDFDITIENSKTGAGVNIKGDRPLSRILFWASLKTLCPETYIDINVEPDQDFTWTFTYNFYTLDNRGP